MDPTGGVLLGIYWSLGKLFGRGGEAPLPPVYNIPVGPGTEIVTGPEEYAAPYVPPEFTAPYQPPEVPASPTPPAPPPPAQVPPDIPSTPIPPESPAPQPIGGGWQVDPAVAAYAVLRRTRRPSKRPRRGADSGVASQYLLGFVARPPPPVEIPAPRRVDQPFPMGPIWQPPIRVLPRRKHTEPGIGPPGHVPLPRGPDIRPGRRDSPWPFPLPGEQIPPPRRRTTSPGTTSPPGLDPTIPGITIPPPEIQLPRREYEQRSPPVPGLTPPEAPPVAPPPPTRAPGQVRIGQPTVQNPLLRHVFPVVRRRRKGDVSPVLRQQIAPPAEFLDRYGDPVSSGLTALTQTPLASAQQTALQQKRKQCEQCEEEAEEKKKKNRRPSNVIAKVKEFGRRMSQNSLDNLR